MDRRALPKETIETAVAFRAGVKGLPFNATSGPHPEMPVVANNIPGPNERHMELIEELPGLSEVVGAYETGRAIRMIGYIFDSDQSPVTEAQLFLRLLTEALVTFRMRGDRQPWGADDTVYVFMEHFAGSIPRTIKEQTRLSLLDYAQRRPETTA